MGREFIVPEGDCGGAWLGYKELVRCKDCIHYWKNWKDEEPDDEVAVCLASPRDDAFCSEGERRNDGDGTEAG